MQAEPMMVDPYLHSELRPNEQLLWWGKPDLAHSMKGNNYTVTLIVVWSVLAIILLALSIICASLLRTVMTIPVEWDVANLTTLQISMVALLLISLATFGICLYRLYLLWKLRHKHATDIKNTLYGITNQRVIVMTATRRGLAVASYTREDIGQISRVETGGGWGDVMYGKPRHIQRGTRQVAVVSKLAGIPNVRQVEDILTRTFKNTETPPVPPAIALQEMSQVQYPPAPEEYMQPLARDSVSPASQE